MTTTVADLAATLQAVFTTDADDAAAAAGVVRRRRLLSGATFVQTVTFGWLANPDAALDELAELAADLGSPVSPQALDQRFTPPAVACLSRTLDAALLRLVRACPVAAPVLERFAGVYARDCSTIALPGALAGAWPGCGHGNPAVPSAAVKLHVGVELTGGQLEGLSLQPGRTSDRCCAGTHAPLPEGALLLEDLGFFDVPRLRHYADQGAWVLSRAPTRLLVRPDGGPPRRVAVFLGGVPGERLDCWVTIGRRQKAWRCRLLAVRVPPEVEQQRRQRAEREAKSLGRAVSAERRALCAWTVLLTNAPRDLLRLEEALALRRLRWQIELLFRVWKDEGRVDETRGRKPYRVLCEVLAKLLGQVVQHWATLLAGGPLEISGVKAARRVRRRAARLAESLAVLAALVTVLGRLQERLRRFARKRGRPGRPTTLEIVRAPGWYGWAVPPAEGDEGTDRRGSQASGPALPEERADAA
jgi:Transposase DDE domain